MTKEEAVIQGLQGHVETLNETIEKQDKIIKALKQQTSDDCVSRAEVIKSIQSDININFEGQRGLEKYAEDVKLIIQCLLDEQDKRVKDLPPVTPTRKVGKWIKSVKPSGLKGHECSECGSFYPLIEGLNYCPNCGADMRGSENE